MKPVKSKILIKSEEKLTKWQDKFISKHHKEFENSSKNLENFNCLFQSAKGLVNIRSNRNFFEKTNKYDVAYRKAYEEYSRSLKKFIKNYGYNGPYVSLRISHDILDKKVSNLIEKINLPTRNKCTNELKDVLNELREKNNGKSYENIRKLIKVYIKNGGNSEGFRKDYPNIVRVIEDKIKSKQNAAINII